MTVATINRHLGYQHELCPTADGWIFVLGAGGIEGWDSDVRPPPDHMTLATAEELAGLDFDIFLAQTVPDWNWAQEHVTDKPVVCLEHCTPLILSPYEAHPNTNLLVVANNLMAQMWVSHNDLEPVVIVNGVTQDEYPEWCGGNERVLTLRNAHKQRGEYTGYELWSKVAEAFPVDLYGFDNEGWQNSRDWVKTKALFQTYEVYLDCTICNQPGFALLEAMATGMPIVCRTVGEYPITVEHGVSGFSFSGDDLGNVYPYLFCLLRDDKLRQRFSEAVRERAARLFSGERFRREWRQVFERAVGK